MTTHRVLAGAAVQGDVAWSNRRGRLGPISRIEARLHGRKA